MDQVDFEVGVDLAFDAIVQDRLAFICGAGLSMAGPSNIPSAWAVASNAKREYDAIYGMAKDPLSEDIEEQAEFFHGKGQLATTYLTKLIDNNTFSAPPNNGDNDGPEERYVRFKAETCHSACQREHEYDSYDEIERLPEKVDALQSSVFPDERSLDDAKGDYWDKLFGAHLKDA